MRIYVAGPYTKGDVALNVRAAIEAGDALASLGHAPFIPHLTHFWHLLHPHEIDFWYELDLVWLRECDAILRLPGESHGADREVEVAELRGMHVFWSIHEVSEA